MKQIIVIILLLTLVIGCSNQQTINPDEITTDDIESDLAELTILEEELDLSELDSLEQDLDNLI